MANWPMDAEELMKRIRINTNSVNTMEVELNIAIACCGTDLFIGRKDAKMPLCFPVILMTVSIPFLPINVHEKRTHKNKTQNSCQLLYLTSCLLLYSINRTLRDILRSFVLFFHGHMYHFLLYSTSSSSLQPEAGLSLQISQIEPCICEL